MNGDIAVTQGQQITKLAVIHWFPLEQFPPVQNLLTCISGTTRLDCCCLSTANDRGLPDFSVESLAVLRRPFPTRRRSRLVRLWLLLSFPFWACWCLLWFRPDALLYFEPHSSAAAFLYLLCRPRCRLLIHYHEYREPREYRDPGNRLFGWYHRLERRFLYRRAIWISETNSDRVRFFLQDTPEVDPAKLRVLPNYPPAAWSALRAATRGESTCLRLVYVGAASIRDTFVAEVVRWVQNQPTGAVSLDLYVNNSDVQTEQMLRQAEAVCDHLRLYSGGVPYHQLPELLRQYDVGLILYRGTTLNYVYNAPNKLFEYLACGLDVWFPGCMLGVKPYARSHVWPRILETDFQRLAELNLQVLKRRDLPYEPWQGSSEAVLQPLLQAIACDAERPQTSSI